MCIYARETQLMGPSQGEDEAVASDITRALIKGLPRLFVKYQTDPGRMSDVLLLPQLMNLDMYLEMRMMTVRLFTALLTHRVTDMTSNRLTLTCGTT